MIPFAYQVFSTVIQEGTFQKAALKLNVTPSAVSHSITQLETELGFPVFIRSRSGAELTANGRTILPIIQEILNSQARLEQEAADINGLNAGSIRIGAFSSVCINWLPPIIQSFKKTVPPYRYLGESKRLQRDRAGRQKRHAGRGLRGDARQREPAGGLVDQR